MFDKISRFSFILLFSFFLTNVFCQNTNFQTYYPNNNSITTIDTITLRWNRPTDAIDYSIQIAIDENFTNIIHNINNQITNKYLISNLSPNQTYYWRIKARTNSGYTNWSAVSIFTYSPIEQIPGLKLLLKANEGVTLNSNNVSQWLDQSNNNYILSQPGASLRPLLKVNAINNKPALEFDGTNDYLDFNNQIDLSNFSIIFLFKPKNTIISSTPMQTFLSPSINGTVFTPLLFGPVAGAISNETFSFCNWGSFPDEKYSYIRDPLINKYQLIVSSLSNNTFKFSIDNILKNTYSGSGGLNSTTGRSIQGLKRLGAWYNAGSCFNGELAELFIYNKELSNSELNIINTYISEKYSTGNIELGENINIDYGFCDTTITAPLGYSEYYWSTGDTSRSIKVGAGKYFVQAKNKFGHLSSDTIFVFQSNISIKDSLFCPSNTVNLRTTLDSTKYTFNWSTTSSYSNINISTLGTYSLTISDTNNCSTILTYNLKPLVYFKTESTCKNIPFQFSDLSSLPTSDQITSWLWSFGDGNNSSIQNPIHSYTLGSNYNVQLSINTSNGCTLLYDTTITVVNSVASPNPFLLSFPYNNYPISNPNVSFKWNGSNNAYKYSIQLSTDSIFSSISKIYNNIFDTVFSTTDFPLGQNYFWRVLAYNTCGASITSNYNKILAFLPSSIGDINTWIMADSNIVTASNLVTSWADITSNQSLLQSIASSKPQIIYNVINKKPVVRFDGINDYMDFLYDINLSDFSIFAVYKPKDIITSASSPQTLLANSVTNDPSCQIWTGVTSNYLNGETMSFWSEKTYPDWKTNYITEEIDSTFQLLNFDLERDTFSLWMNNLTPLITTVTNGGLNSDLNRSLSRIKRLGAYVGPSLFFKGDIAEMIVFNKSLSKTEKNNVLDYLRFKYAGPPVYLGPDISIPYGFCDTTLDAGPRFIEYHWSTGETTSSIQVNNGGTYWVQAKDPFGFVSSDTIVINKPKVTLNDTTICLFSTAPFDIKLGSNYSYLWSTGETTENITTSTIGNIWFKVSDTLGCQYIDTLTITADSFEVTTSLGLDRNFCDGDTLRLITGQLPGNSYLWNNNSTLPYSVIQYPGGNYHLTVTNSRACQATDTINLNIIGYAPSVVFSAPSGCFNYTTAFIDNSSISPSGTIGSRVWDFGDDSIFSGLNPSHQYQDTGIYNVSLTITTTAGCSRTLEKNIQVYPLPHAYFNPTNGCTDDTIHFDDMSVANFGSLSNWNWNFGNSNTSIVQNPAQSYNSIGNYDVQLIVTTNFGCKDTINRTVKIKQSPYIDFDYTTVCYGLPVTFWEISDAPNYHPIDAWAWNFNDGSSVDSTKNPTHFFSSPGIYPVSLTLHSLSGCEVSKVKNVKVNAIPVADFYTNNLCVGQSLVLSDSSKVQSDSISSWNWNIENNGTYNTQNPIVTIADTGTYEIKLEVKSSGGCSDSTQRTVIINPAPKANFTFDPTYGTAPLAVTFTNTSNGGNNYTWDFGDSSSVVFATNTFNTYVNNGDYLIKLLVENNYGCFDSIIKTLNIKPSLLDLSIIAISKIQTEGSIRLKVDLTNIGTRPIYSFDLEAQIAGSTAIIETWNNGALESGQFLTYTFNSAFALSEANNPEYICVNIKNPNLEIDENPSNDESCILLGEEFKMFDLYPNPTSDEINIEYIIPIKDDVTIGLYDYMGKAIISESAISMDKGFHRITQNISKLKKGTYAIRINYRDKSDVKVFVKN